MILSEEVIKCLLPRVVEWLSPRRLSLHPLHPRVGQSVVAPQWPIGPGPKQKKYVYAAETEVECTGKCE